MAEQSNAQAIVPSTVIEGEYMVEVKEFDPAGKVTALSVHIPSSSVFDEWSMMQKVVMLKKGAWRAQPVNEIVFAVAYAKALGLDIMQGDVFPTGNGRIGTSNKAKIKTALATHNIEGIQTEIAVLPDAFDASGCVQKKDLECTVTIHVKGWKVPIVRKARLSRWYKGTNPNWKENPEHMLTLNTVAHACELVAPGGTEGDEAPPIAPSTEITTAVKSAIDATPKEKKS
jgi:hypothetical protein